MLAALRGPVVLFVHPWEFVDLTDTDLRWDCRVGTGVPALEKLEEVIGFYRRRGARFIPMRDLAPAAGGSPAEAPRRA